MHKKLWNKDYILMLQGNAVSALGDIVYSVAIGYWVYEETGSSALMGLMSSISMFMSMLLSPFTGSIVDKSNRKAIIVGMDILRGIIMLFIGALAFRNKLSVSAVLGAAVLASLCSAFFSPAVSTFLLDIIPADDMVRGQSVSSGISSLVLLVGKAVSGALVAFLGVPVIIVLNGICYLISAFTELFLTVPKSKQQGQTVTLKGVGADFKAAIGAVFANPYLSLVIPSMLILNVLGTGPFSLMLPFVMEKGFTVDMYGYLMSFQTAAWLICVAILSIIRLSPKQRYYSMSLGFTVSTLLLCGAYCTKNYTLLCILMFAGCFANSVGNAVFNATLMLALPESHRGAILGLVNAFSTGGCALSAVIYGVLGDFFPLSLVFTVGTLLAFLPITYVCFHKKTRECVLSH